MAAVPGGSLLELEQYHAVQRRKLLVLQLVATLCESVSDTVFTDIAQVGHGKVQERVANRTLGCWALRRQWLRNSWRKLEHPQEKQFIDSVGSVSTRHRPVWCQQEGQSQLQRQEGAAQQTSSDSCPWLCIKSQESSLCVNQNSDLPASRLYFEQNLLPSLTKLKDICACCLSIVLVPVFFWHVSAAASGSCGSWAASGINMARHHHHVPLVPK